MTRAPANLLAVRSLLLTHLDNAPGPNDLESAEVGIVGDPAHRGGYHCGSDRVDLDDYSVDESTRDRAGLTLDASALDVGMFEVTVGGRTFDLPHFSAWCVGQCKANAADARDIREIIWSPDGRTVLRWDRLGKRSSGDDSHRWHTHFSFFRDAIKAGRDQRPLFRRYLASIGLLEDDDMTPDQVKDAVLDALAEARPFQSRGLGNANPGVELSARTLLEYAWSDARQIGALRGAIDGADDTDEQAIITGVLAGLTPAAIAAAIPPTLAKQVADELARRLVAETTPQS